MSEEIKVTEVQIWSVRNAEASRVKAMATVTFNGALRVSGVRIIEGAKGLFVSWPFEKRPGSDQCYALFHVTDRRESDRIQDVVLRRFQEVDLHIPRTSGLG